MSLTMRSLIIFVAPVACASYGQHSRSSDERTPGSSSEDGKLKALATMLMAFDPAAAFNPAFPVAALPASSSRSIGRHAVIARPEAIAPFARSVAVRLMQSDQDRMEGKDSEKPAATPQEEASSEEAPKPEEEEASEESTEEKDGEEKKGPEPAESTEEKDGEEEEVKVETKPDIIGDLKRSISFAKRKLEVLEKERIDIIKETEGYAAQAEKLKADFGDKIKREESNLETWKKSHAVQKEAAKSIGAGKAVLDMMESVDNLARARSFLGDVTEEDKPTFQKYIDAESDLFKTLETELNVTKIPCEGLTYDPRLHEAMQMIPGTGLPPQFILEEVTSGWKMGDDVIRHAGVVVAE